MEQLIAELYSPTNQSSSARIQEIQRQIQHLQREKSAWQLGLDFLARDDANIRFYGALTLIVKINADWDKDGIAADSSMRDSLLQELISHYVRLSLSGDAAFVIQKLCSTLAALYQRLADTWLLPVRHVFACLIGHQYIVPSQLPPLDEILNVAQSASPRLLSVAVRFAATLAEDVIARTGRAGEELQLSDSCNDAFELLRLGLGSSIANLARPKADAIWLSSGQEYLDLAEMSIQAIQPWHSLLSAQASRASKEETKTTAEVVSQALGQTILLHDHSDLRAFVLQTLVVVQQSSPRLLTRADPNFPQSFLRSDAVRQSIQNLHEGNFDHEGILLVDLLEAIMSQIDSTSAAYLRSERWTDVLEALQLLLRCEGVATIDDPVCQVVLEILNQLVDGHTDWTEDSDDEMFKDYVRRGCEACFSKATIPIEEMTVSTQTWDADEKTKFSVFRFDVQDFLLASYPILGASLPSAVTHNLGDIRDPPDWPAYEVSIFCLRAFADAMSDEPERFTPYIEAAFGSQYFQTVLQSAEVPEQARKTTIAFIADTTSFLKHHPNLMQILNFLFSSLHLPASASSASQAIYTLCYEQRASLTEALPGFMASLGTVGESDAIDRHRIYGGVASIIQALHTEQAKVGPITQILQLLSSTTEDFESQSPDQEAVTSHCADILRSMAAVGRGLRTPNDVPVDLDAEKAPESGFWTTGPGSLVQHLVLALYSRVLERASQIRDSGLTEAACDFLRSGLTEEHPSPFKFSTATSTKLVTDQISLDSPNIDSVLGCASCLLASAERGEMGSHLPALLSPVLTTVQQLLSDHQRDGTLGESSFPSATLDFVNRLLPKWIDPLLDLSEGKKALEIIIELALVVMADPDTLPRRSAASFFGTLVTMSKPQQMLTRTSRAALNQILQQNSPRIIGLLLRLVAGECARSELEVLAGPIREYVQYQPMLFKNIGREIMNANNGVLSDQAFETSTPDQRSRFLAKVDTLRGSRKTVEVVKDFWISCRGAGFSYLA